MPSLPSTSALRLLQPKKGRAADRYQGKKENRRRSVLPGPRVTGYPKTMAKVTDPKNRTAVCFLLLCSTVFLNAAAALPAQEDGEGQGDTAREQAAAAARQAERAGEIAALQKWFADYQVGAIRLSKQGQLDEPALNAVRSLLAGVSRWNDVDAARLLFEIATVQPRAPGSSDTSMSQVDFYDELRVQRVHTLAREAIAAMDNAAVEEWLLGIAQKNRAEEYEDIATPAGAALRILSLRPGSRAKEALLRGARSLKPEVRVHAVNAMSMAASLDLVPHFFDFARDKEPYVRIAALNGIGRGLAPHTDETVHTSIPEEVQKLRDEALLRLKDALIRDRVWQVRAAARANLVELKSKHVIPVLIQGLETELGLTKDPWALDIRLHRALEKLTGVSMPVGSAASWKDFWKKEAASFAFARAGQAATGSKDQPSRYEKFFNIALESDRVMFVVDFSGSMVENITIKTPGVGTQSDGGDRQTTKAQLVVEELKKMVFTLKDGDMFNIIVFSDDARIWRTRDDGRPALVKMNDDLRDELLGSFLDNLKPAGMTNLYAALGKALDFGGRGLHDKYYGLGYDTLYILSDGAPTAGKVTDTEEILRMVRETNALKRLTIHTITFGELNQLIFLKKLAEENGGRHIHVE